MLKEVAEIWETVKNNKKSINGDKILYSSTLKASKFNKDIRKRLQDKKRNKENAHPIIDQTMKFGSMNIHGLDCETNLAIQTLIKEYNHDVSTFF